MRYNSLALGLAAVAPLALAQTKSECDPTKGDKCAPDPAFGKCREEQVFDFTSVAHGDGWRDDDGFRDLWKPDDGVLGNDSPLSIDNNGAIFTITKDDQAPLIKSKKYIFFGKVEVEMKAAPGRGIVTSIVLESDDRDEIDWEWVGADQGNVQTNFFSKGVNEYIHGKTHGVAFNPMDGLHKYSIEWTPDFIIFKVDGAEIRRATPAEAENGKKWPQTPTFIKLGTWVGGKPGGSQGTIDWAGGLVDMSQAPFVGWYKEIRITDYCGGKDQAAQYVYSDASGSMESIKVDGSTRDEGFGDAHEENTTSVAKPTESKTPTEEADEPAETGTESDKPATNPPNAAAGLKASSALAGLVFLGFLLWA